jgi:hypothetical protein
MVTMGMCITRFVYLELLTQVSLKGNINSKMSFLVPDIGLGILLKKDHA